MNFMGFWGFGVLGFWEFFEVAYIASGLSLHWSEYDCEVSNFSFINVDFF